MWKKVTDVSPPLNTIIDTKVDDQLGTRNEQSLKFDGKLWWMSDGSMYVYYTPTHWKNK